MTRWTLAQLMGWSQPGHKPLLNTFRSEQNGRHSAEDIFKRIFILHIFTFDWNIFLRRLQLWEVSKLPVM